MACDADITTQYESNCYYAVNFVTIIEAIEVRPSNTADWALGSNVNISVLPFCASIPSWNRPIGCLLCARFDFDSTVRYVRTERTQNKRSLILLDPIGILHESCRSTNTGTLLSLSISGAEVTISYLGILLYGESYGSYWWILPRERQCTNRRALIIGLLAFDEERNISARITFLSLSSYEERVGWENSYQFWLS